MSNVDNDWHPITSLFATDLEDMAARITDRANALGIELVSYGHAQAEAMGYIDFLAMGDLENPSPAYHGMAEHKAICAADELREFFSHWTAILEFRSCTTDEEKAAAAKATVERTTQYLQQSIIVLESRAEDHRNRKKKP